MSEKENEEVAETEAGDTPQVEVESTSEDPELEAKRLEAAQEKIRKTRKPASGFKALKIVLIFLLILLLGLIAGAAWFVYQQTLKQQSMVKEEISRLESVIAESQQHSATLANQQNALLNSARQQERQYQQQMQMLEQRLQAQQKKILSLSTSTQDDWILAEAEYLLRLANQRVLIEGNARSALALLEKVDEIVRGLDDPDLLPLRQQLAQDLASLRLVKDIDLEGIYFLLTALANEVENLNPQPTRKRNTQQSSEQEETPSDDATEVEELSWWQKLGRGVRASFAGLDNYIRISWQEEARPVLLSPEHALYLKQNLRLKLERSQLALLREEPAIYQASLQEVVSWLQQYFPVNPQRDSFIEQVEALSERNITQVLPDISASLKLLQSHIEMLHDLNPESSEKPAVQSAPPSVQTEEML